MTDLHSKEHNTHFATWLINVTKVLGNTIKRASWYSALKAHIPLGQKRCIYKFHLQNRKVVLQLLALWPTCWLASLGLCTFARPLTHHLQNPLVHRQCYCWWWWWETQATLHHACHAWSHSAALKSNSALRPFSFPVYLIFILLVAACFLMTESSSWVTYIYIFFLLLHVVTCFLIEHKFCFEIYECLNSLTFSLAKQNVKPTCHYNFFSFFCDFPFDFD